MHYDKITLPTAPERLDDDCVWLTARGFDCFQIEDERDILEQSPYWEMTDEAVLEHYRDACRFLLYLPRGADSMETLAELREHFPMLSAETVRDDDWAESWKQYYQPILIGRRLAVHPEWLERPDYGSRAVYLSNPGMSFGTGLHATTRLCLERLEAIELTGASVLDIGCGSGILGICALLLGAERSVAVDIDPLAAEITRDTAAKNGVAGRLTAHHGNFLESSALRGTVGGGFSLVLSNIVADVILALIPLMREHLAKNGLWMVSGIIDTRAEEVEAALREAGFALERFERDGWVMMVLS